MDIIKLDTDETFTYATVVLHPGAAQNIRIRRKSGDVQIEEVRSGGKRFWRRARKDLAEELRIAVADFRNGQGSQVEHVGQEFR